MEIDKCDKSEKVIEEIKYRCDQIEKKVLKCNKAVEVLDEEIEEMNAKILKKKADVEASQALFEELKQEKAELLIRLGPGRNQIRERMAALLAQQSRDCNALRAEIAATRAATINHSNEMEEKMRALCKRRVDLHNAYSEESLQRRYERATEELSRLRQGSLRESNDRLLARLLDPKPRTHLAHIYTEKQLLKIVGIDELNAALRSEQEKLERLLLQASAQGDSEHDGTQASSSKR